MKIISFSVYGKLPKYTIAAIANAKLQPSIYPEWTCRFYVDTEVPEEIVGELLSLGSQVIRKPKSDGHKGLFWRFEPLKDLEIERFIVRDSDSRLNEREAAAVKEWEESGLPFHIMRDHPQHGAPICGGMWGASRDFIKEEAPYYDREVDTYFKGLTPDRIYSPRGMYFNTDQPWLWKCIWPKIINKHIAHIKDLPNLRFSGREKLFPIENRDGSFVGQPLDI